jgi:hypothetical protein
MGAVGAGHIEAAWKEPVDVAQRAATYQGQCPVQDKGEGPDPALETCTAWGSGARSSRVPSISRKSTQSRAQVGKEEGPGSNIPSPSQGPLAVG